MVLVTMDEVRRARECIADVSVRTPLVEIAGIEIPDGNELWVKAENLQRTGSFKFRGAYNAVASLSDDEREKGVITYSSGNHGQAVACAAHLLGVPAMVVMPLDALPLKIDATRRWGAAVELAGHSSLDRMGRARELVAERGFIEIPPFDDARIIAGQGTCGLEMLDQLPDVDVVLVPVGGGGLISGIATAIKAVRPDVRIVGVEPEQSADARDSLRKGAIVTWDQIETVADGLRTSRVGRLNFETIWQLVDDIVTVNEEQILRAIGVLAGVSKLVVEPSGATAPAAALFGTTGVRSKKMAAVISGGNVDPARLISCLEMTVKVGE